VNFELALHAWIPGQLLSPGHFERQEQALLAHMAARFRLSGLPAYGIAALELDAAELERGWVVVRKLEWVLRDGTLLSTEGNVEPIEPLEVEPRQAVPIHAVVLPPREPGDGIEASQVLPRCYRVRLVAGHPPWSGELEELASRRDQSMQLLTLEPKRGGRGASLGRYVPPLLQVCTTPFLRAELLALYESIQYANDALRDSARARTATGARASDVQRRRAQGQKLRAVLRESSVVHDRWSGRGPRLHPYQLFCALRDYACELAASPGTPIDVESLVYDHDDLRGCYGALFAAISGEASAVPDPTPAGLELVREGRLFVARNLPEEVLGGDRELCLAIHGDVRLEDLVLGSPGRLPTLHELLLPGLRAAPVQFSYAPAGGPDTRYYRLECSGVEWEHVRRERALCFQRPVGVAVRASLVWRGADGVA